MLNLNFNVFVLIIPCILDSAMSPDGRNFIRSAKSGSDWTENELLAYNIKVSRQESQQFFGRELGSIDHLDPNLLSTVKPSIATHLAKETYRFLTYLDLASHANVGQESATDDFGKNLLEIMGYDEPGTIVRSRYHIPLTISGETKAAKADVCLVHTHSMVLLIIQEDKTNTSLQSPEAQVIAEAIGAFQYNNRIRCDHHLIPLEAMTIPCITMVGTRPCFYKVPVTQELSSAVISAQYPEQPTIVTCCALAAGQSRAWKCQIIVGLPYGNTTLFANWHRFCGSNLLLDSKERS